MTAFELAGQVVERLRKKNWKISTAESCTGGLVARYLTSVSGASEVFEYGIVSYANRIKIQELGVSPQTLEEFGAVSRDTALQMAQGVRRKAQSDWGISTTGIAGPTGGTLQKPVGTVHIAVCGAQVRLHRKLTLDPNGGREEIRMEAAKALLQLLLEALNDASAT